MKEIMKIDPVIILSESHQRPISLDITFASNQKPKPVILHIHGFKGFKDWGFFNQMADFFAQRDYIFIKMNFSHNGVTPDHPTDFIDLEAFGKNNFSIEQADMDHVIDFIFSGSFTIDKEEINLDKFFLTGHSRGGAAAILKGFYEKRVKAVAAWAAVNDLANHYSHEILEKWKNEGVIYIENSRTEQQMPLYYQLAEDYIQNEDKLNIPDAVKHFDKPLFIAHGTKDQTVPVKAAYRMKEWNDSIQLSIIEEADHVFGGQHPWENDHLPPDAEKVMEKTIAFFNAL